MRRILPFLILSASLLLAACWEDRVAGGAGVGNPPLADVSLTFKARSSKPVAKAAAEAAAALPEAPFTVRDSAGNLLTLLSIEARVRRVEFEVPAGISCAGLEEVACEERIIPWALPFKADLMTGITNPPLSLFRLPVGIYTAFGLDFMDAGKGTGSVPWDTALQNLSIHGRLGADTGGKEFRVKLNLEDGMDFRNTEGISISKTGPNAIHLQVVVDDWFQGVDMAKCLADSLAPVDGSGALILPGDGGCRGAGGRIRSNIETSGQVGDDNVVSDE